MLSRVNYLFSPEIVPGGPHPTLLHKGFSTLIKEAEMFEIHGQNGPFVLRGHVQEPHQQKKGHHGGNKVGVSHFPASAMVLAMDLFYSFYDDFLGAVFHFYFFLEFFITVSSSRNEGLSSPGTTLLANSMAT